VSLAGCERVRGDAIANLVNSCPFLTDLNITQCQVQDVNMRAMAVNCTRLQRLKMGFCRHVTDEGFKDAARFCFALEHADLRGLRKISDGSVNKLSQTALHLRHLDIRGCQSLSLQAVQMARRALPECHMVSSHIS
jgi:F-box/leucine-rich repeat protein 7